MKYTEYILFALCLLLYGNTIQHGFVMDDVSVLMEHKHVQQGISGIVDIFKEDSFAAYLSKLGYSEQIITGGRYRPLSLAVFAVGVTLWGNNPLYFHLLNILLFAACTLVFYRLVRTLLPNQPLSALAAVVLFAVHPIHTEVVANIKSADELLAFLFGAIAVTIAIKPDFSIKNQIISSILMLLALFSKEIAIVWVVLIPLFRFSLLQENVKKVATRSLFPIVAALLYIGVRSAVIAHPAAGTMMQDPMNNPMINVQGQWLNTNAKATDALDNVWRFKGENRPFTFAERTATVSFILLQYVKLMFVPYPLSHDYSPFHIRVKNWSDPMVLFSCALIVGLLVWSMWALFRKRKLAGWALLWFILPLIPVCNLFFTVGTLLAERFLMMPSGGFCLLLGLGMGYLFQKNLHFTTVLGGLVALALSGLTILRNQAWKSNETLLETDMNHTPQSAHIYLSYGDLKVRAALAMKDSLAQAAALRKTIPILEKGLSLHPLHYMAWHGIGIAHFTLKDYESAIKDYQIANVLFYTDLRTKQNLAASIRQQGQVFMRKGSTSQAIRYLEKAYQLSPDSTILPMLTQLKQQK
jgi:protein O-mannosyl-transferase